MDSVPQSDKDWLLNIQRKLFQWSDSNSEEAYGDLWNWVTDPRNLRLAFQRVATNKGANTSGIDGETVSKIRHKTGEAHYLKDLRGELREGHYRPSPVRRHWIPKPGKPNQRRGLGIPTIRDRIVQGAIKQVTEPIFEARFFHVSNGFRPGRSARDAIELIRHTLTSRTRNEKGQRTSRPYEWVIEGDIKACFDNISHHALMVRVRSSISDRKVTRLIKAFLKAGIMEELKFSSTNRGTPQGGILSPMLANVALQVVEEQYRRWFHPKGYTRASRYKASDTRRRWDRLNNKPIYYPVRYADDFVILCSCSFEQAKQKKEELAAILKQEMGLELSQEKTHITSIDKGFVFLSHKFRRRWNPRWGWTIECSIPKDRQLRLRRKIKSLSKRDSTNQSLDQLIGKLNPIVRGWANYYCHASMAATVFTKMDRFTFHRVYSWLQKKHPKTSKAKIYLQNKGCSDVRGWTTWRGSRNSLTAMTEVPRGRWNWKNRRLPLYMHPAGEPSA